MTTIRSDIPAAFEILVKNPQQFGGGVNQITVDETALGPEKAFVSPVRDRKVHKVRMILGAPTAVKEKSLEH